MGGFFPLCTRPNEDRADEVSQLQVAFAELGFPSPGIVKAERYIFAAYPSLQSRSIALKVTRSGACAGKILPRHHGQ